MRPVAVERMVRRDDQAIRGMRSQGVFERLQKFHLRRGRAAIGLARLGMFVQPPLRVQQHQ